jgi:hypothetical protein
MIQEIDAKPANLRGFRQSVTSYNTKLQRHMTIAQLLSKLPRKPSLWNERSPLNYVDRLARLPFPLRLFWSSHDTVVGNQATNQTGKLYKQIKAKKPIRRRQAGQGALGSLLRVRPRRPPQRRLTGLRTDRIATPRPHGLHSPVRGPGVKSRNMGPAA